MRLRRARVRLLLASTLLVQSGCWPSTSVQRVVHGRTLDGPEVSEQAYAMYARGAYHEARGELQAAAAAYRAALDSDAKSAAIWTRLGAVTCTATPGDAQEAFERALALDENHAPAWFEQARCLQRNGQPAPALASAERAVALSPGATDVNLLVVRLYEESQRTELAERWLLALVVREPQVLAHWGELLSFAQAHGRVELALYARQALAQRAERDSASALVRPVRAASAGAVPAEVALDELQRALAAGDLELARVIAARARISPARLSVLALAGGHPALAAAQAELVLGAEADNSDALVAALSAAQLAPDEERLERLLRVSSTGGAPSAEAAALLAALIRWRVGEQAAQAWQRAYAQSTGAGKN
jgi:tetratricopeptide (TPR) repeat protein